MRSTSGATKARILAIKRKSGEIYKYSVLASTVLAGIGILGSTLLKQTIGLPETEWMHRTEKSEITFKTPSAVDFCAIFTIGEGEGLECGFTDRSNIRRATTGERIACTSRDRNHCKEKPRYLVDTGKSERAIYKNTGMEDEPPFLWEGWKAYYGLSWFNKVFYRAVTGWPYAAGGLLLASSCLYAATFVALSIMQAPTRDIITISAAIAVVSLFIYGLESTFKNGYLLPRKPELKAARAKSTLINIAKQCAIKSAQNIAEPKFQTENPNPRGNPKIYSIFPTSNNCSGDKNGNIHARSNQKHRFPDFTYNIKTGRKSCSHNAAQENFMGCTQRQNGAWK